ncbi:MAG TPA: hypothetical protein VGO80_10865 [Solirubrobacteraceae bacterium]|nr:hypothetical protein [Solirubrobacteraceae bacterium]
MTFSAALSALSLVPAHDDTHVGQAELAAGSEAVVARDELVPAVDRGARAAARAGRAA